MNARIQSLGQEARALSAEERCELVDDILASIYPSNAVIDAAWANEARDRLDAWRRGELTSIPAQEVFAKYRKA
jgi:putative addiction module component (TIGR02574 family)